MLALSLGAGSATCERTPPARPEPPRGVSVRFEDAGGALREHEAAIRALIGSTLTRVGQALPVADVTITVNADARRTIPRYGLGGFAPDGHEVQVSVDASFPGLAEALPERLPPLLAHELHHCVRWRGPGYGRTLFEALVSEGLADHFAVELLGVPAPPWTDAFPRDRTAHYLALARPELDAPYDHPRWFFTGDAALPRWTGYTLGYRLVEDYLERHPGETAARLVHAPADAFRPE